MSETVRCPRGSRAVCVFGYAAGAPPVSPILLGNRRECGRSGKQICALRFAYPGQTGSWLTFTRKPQ